MKLRRHILPFVVLSAVVVKLSFVSSFHVAPARRPSHRDSPRGDRWHGGTRLLSSKVVSPVPVSSRSTIENGPIVTADAVICGGGPAGLLTAIMLAQQRNGDDTTPRFAKIHVYDRLEAPPGPDDDTVWNDVARFYLIGLGGRGQRALRQLGLWDAVERRCTAVVGRKDWTPESSTPTERIFGPERRTTTQVLPRDKLVGVLHEHIQTHHAEHIALYYGRQVEPLEFDVTNGMGATALLRVAQCTPTGAPPGQRVNPSSSNDASKGDTEADVVCDTDVSYVSTPFLVAADGAGRTIANAIEALEHSTGHSWRRPKLTIHRFPDDNQRIYKTIPLTLPRDWRGDLNYSARTKRVNFDALPANARGEYCGVLLLRAKDPMAAASTDPRELRALLDDALPQFSCLLDDATVEAVALKPVSYLPAFRYVSRLHKGATTVLLGDAAHQVKPYFGLGCNSALEDVIVLSEALAQHPTDTPSAVRLYSQRRSPEAKVLVKLSRDLDRPGPLGVFMFIVPIIMDSIFVKLWPKLFLPNVITMLQNEDYTFQRLARRKRLDRAVQVLLLTSAATVLGLATKTAVHAVATLLKTRPTFVWTGLLCTALVKPLWARIQPKTQA